MFLHDWRKLKIRDLNDSRREILINKALELGSEYEKAKFIVDYFTNNLPKNIVSQIDGVDENKVVDFKYDYSYIKGDETPFARKQQPVNSPVGEGITFSTGLHDIDIPGHPMIYPSVIGLKLGTCKIFSHEIARIMHSVGIKCEIVETKKPVSCYDLFEGTDEHDNHISVNTIKPMYHIYNVITIDGKQYKVDVAGYLTSQDYNHYHPDGIKFPIDTSRFCMTEDIASNPFEETEKEISK